MATAAVGLIGMEEESRLAGLLEEKSWRPKNEKPLHDAIVDQLIATPQANAIQLGQLFGYTPVAMRRILGSDLIKEKLAKRRAEVVDPMLQETLEEKFNLMLEVSLDRATEILSRTTDGDLALKGVDIGARALGYGAKVAPTGPQLVVVNPGVAPNSQAWAAAYNGQVVDAPGPGPSKEG